MKSYKVSDLLRSLRSGRNTDSYVKEALARGGRTLVIDENVEVLNQLLKEKKGYTTLIAFGSDEDIKRKLVRNKILITNNSSDFDNPLDLQRFYYGLVIVPHPKDIYPDSIADKVEEILMRANFAKSLLQIWKIEENLNYKKLLEIEND